MQLSNGILNYESLRPFNIVYIDKVNKTSVYMADWTSPLNVNNPKINFKDGAT